MQKHVHSFYPVCQAKFYDPENQQEEIHQICMFFASIHPEIGMSIPNKRLQEVEQMFKRGCATQLRFSHSMLQFSQC